MTLGRARRRQLAAVGAALALVVVAAVYLSRRGGDPAPPAPTWYTAIATVAPLAAGAKTTCGVVLRSGQEAVRFPQLPCGVKLLLERGATVVQVKVVDRGGVPEGTDLALTPALASALAVHRPAAVRWRFAP